MTPQGYFRFSSLQGPRYNFRLKRLIQTKTSHLVRKHLKVVCLLKTKLNLLQPANVNITIRKIIK